MILRLSIEIDDCSCTFAIDPNPNGSPYPYIGLRIERDNKEGLIDEIKKQIPFRIKSYPGYDFWYHTTEYTFKDTYSEFRRLLNIIESRGLINYG